MKIIKKVLFTISIFFMYALFVDAASYDIYTAKYKCPVRKEASEKSEALKSGNDTINIKANQQVEYIETKLGLNNGKENQEWYKIKFDYAAREYTGYVAKACMNDVKKVSYSDDVAFEESIKEFPESYKKYLRMLHALHPTWSFKIDKTNLDWEKAAEAESQKGTSAISHLYPSLIFKDEANPNGIVVDGSNWYAPAKDAVKYYMDPRNFLNEKGIFMFEGLSYNQTADESLDTILKDTFMDSEFTEEDYTKTYKQAFIEAAKQANVSSIHLASRAIQEVGTTESSVVSGKVEGYEGFYNFYNIGATSGIDNYLKGLEYAKSKGWSTRQKAITGGAEFISSGYIAKGQDTIYFEKFNVSSYKKHNAYTHQYMTNIMAPSSEANNIFESYKTNKRLENKYTFIIPVYSNMPEAAYKVSRTDTIGGTEEEKEETKEENKTENKEENKTEGSKTEEPKKEEVKPIIKPEEKVSQAGYKFTNGFLTSVGYESDISDMRSKFTKLGYQVAVVDNSWKSKVTGKVATGDKLSVDEKVYEIAVYGDSTGDGSINSKDLLSIQKYILGLKEFSGVFKESSDVNKDGSINSKDLLRIQKAILGLAEIEQ